MEKKLKVLMLNGSPRKNGNIALAFSEMEKIFEQNDVEYENILLGRMDIKGCIACETCRKNKKCAFDELNKFFTLSNMPVASSQYWNNIYGWEPGEAQVDDEGRQVMRVLARNMVFMMKSIALGKENLGLPETEEHVWTNFTR